MEIVSINPKAKKDKERQEQILEVLDGIRKMVENGEITEFVSCTLTIDGNCQIHVSSDDLVGAVGMFEIGKHILIAQEA
jgi:hypothetical protein